MQEKSEKIWTQIFLVALFYFFLTTPHISFNNTIIYLHDKYHHQGYGQSYLTASSVGTIIGLFTVPLILRIIDLTVRKILIYCSLLTVLYTLIPGFFTIQQISLAPSQISPPSQLRFILQIISNLIAGLCLSFSGILEGVVLAHICQPLSEIAKPTYFSIYNGTVFFRNIIAPLITYIALGKGNETIYYFVLFGFTVLAPCTVNLIKFQGNYSLLEKNQQKCDNNAKGCMKKYWLTLKAMKQFLCFISLFGLIMGLVSGSLSHLLPVSTNPSDNDTKIGIALFVFGIGGTIGSLLTGKIINKMQIKICAWIAPLLFIATLLIEIFFLFRPQSMSGTCIVAFFLGFSISFSSCYLMLLITLNFNASPESFAIYRQIRLIFYIVYQWVVSLVSSHFSMKESMIVQASLLIGLAGISIWRMNIFYKKLMNTKTFELQQDKQTEFSDNKGRESEHNINNETESLQ